MSILYSEDGWLGALSLTFAKQYHKTCLISRQQSGPLTVQRPFYPADGYCHLYILHPPAGLVAGDQLHLSAHLQSDTQVLLTTPGAGKFYRADNDKVAKIQQCFVVENQAALEWLPQNNIIFSGAQVKLKTQFDLADHAKLIAWESLMLGRVAAQEAFTKGFFDGQIRIQRAEKPVLQERLRLNADNLVSYCGRFTLLGNMYITPADSTTLTVARDVLDIFKLCAGATLLDNILVIRLLTHDNEILKRVLYQLWHTLRYWVMGVQPVAPRIWQT